MESYDKPPAFPSMVGYRTLRHLDDGAHGLVFVVEEEATHVELAIKILRGVASEMAGEIDWSPLEHEFLVDVLGTIETSMGPGMLMEYCPAGSAANVVSVRGPLSVGETITVMAPVAEALDFLHARGLTHGDLSPRNILFTAEGKPKLGDYGMHRSLGQSPGDFATTGFCAPESSQQSISGILEPARDIYALAACTWYLLTGRPPSTTVNRTPLGAMVPEVNDEFARLLEQCLDIDPDNRPTAAQFGQRIFVAGEPLAVELSSAVEPEALKHMTTTRQVPAGAGFLGWHRRQGHRSVADKELLKQRTAQIKAQQRRVPRRLRAVIGKTVILPEQDVLDQQSAEAPWTTMHKVHGLRHGNRRIVLGAFAGLLVVILAGSGAYAFKRSSDQHVLVNPTDQVASQSVIHDPLAGATQQRTPGNVQEIILAAAELSSGRDKALMKGDSKQLERLHVEGAPALATDGEVMGRMKKLGVHLEGLQTRLSDVVVLPASAENEVILDATSVQSSYRYLDASGEVIVSVKQPEMQRIQMILRRVNGVWRLWQVSAAR